MWCDCGKGVVLISWTEVEEESVRLREYEEETKAERSSR
jgi:hypothetical protein